MNAGKWIENEAEREGLVFEFELGCFSSGYEKKR